MNYLAHAFLSFNHPEVLVGNMISDFVKGRKKFKYTSNILAGIDLHRAIDDFTDHHPSTTEAKQLFRAEYRLYSGAFIDIVYDHFLANDQAIFKEATVLAGFAAKTYTVLEEFEETLPEDFLMLLPFMKKHNWLYNYQFREGMHRSFAGLVRRARYLTDSEPAFVIFERHYDELENHYRNFFPSLQSFALHHFEELLKK